MYKETREIKADLHFHGPWQKYKENSRESPRTLEEFARHVFDSPLEVVAYTNFVAGEAEQIVNGQQGFFHRFLLPTAKDTKQYGFEISNNGFNIKIYRKSDQTIRYITLTQEIQTSQGHLLCVRAYEHIKPFRKAEDTAKQIIDAGGLVIPDHALVLGGIGEKLVREFAEKQYSGKKIISALEYNSGLPFPFSLSNKKVEKLAQELELPLITNSDAHSWNLGVSYTIYLTESESIDGVKSAIEDNKISGIKKSRGSLPEFILHVMKAKIFNTEK